MDSNIDGRRSLMCSFRCLGVASNPTTTDGQVDGQKNLRKNTVVENWGDCLFRSIS